MAELQLRSSSIDTFLRCPKLYSIKFEQGYEPVDEDPVLVFGSAAHEGLEARGNGKPLADQVGAFSRYARDRPMTPANRIIGPLLLTLYSAKYADEGVTYKHVEYPFCIMMDDGVTEVRGKFDGLCIDENGHWFIMEHKTTRSKIEDGESYWQRKDMNIQRRLYLWAARKLGFDVKYIKYDVIKVPQLKQLKATPKASQKFYKTTKLDKETKEVIYEAGDPRPGTRLRPEGNKEFKDRVMQYMVDNRDFLLKRVDYDYDECEAEDTEGELEEIATLISSGARPKNGSACFDYNRACEFKSVCMRETSLTNTTLYQLNEAPLEY